MSVKTNLLAWTPPIDKPPYLSINRVASIEPIIEVSVRGESKKDGDLGDTVTIKIPEQEFVELIKGMIKESL